MKLIILINFCGPWCMVFRDVTAACEQLGVSVGVFSRKMEKGWFYENGLLVLRGEYIASKRGKNKNLK